MKKASLLCKVLRTTLQSGHSEAPWCPSSAQSLKKAALVALGGSLRICCEGCEDEFRV